MICGDYRAVNEQMVKIAQVVPLIRDIKQKMAGFNYYARFDMAAGFNAVVLHESSRDILAIRTPLGTGQLDCRLDPRITRVNSRK